MPFWLAFRPVLLRYSLTIGSLALCIEPALGELQTASATMPHPNGTIKVQLLRKGVSGIEAQIELAAKLGGTFVWKGRTVSLQAGQQTIRL